MVAGGGRTADCGCGYVFGRRRMEPGGRIDAGEGPGA